LLLIYHFAYSRDRSFVLLNWPRHQRRQPGSHSITREKFSHVQQPRRIGAVHVHADSAVNVNVDEAWENC